MSTPSELPTELDPVTSLVGFTAVLRGAGLAITSDRVSAFLRAVDALDVNDRKQTYWAGRLTLCADVAPAGVGSQWFGSLGPGDEVGFKGPLGGFVYDRGDARTPVFIAEEIGIVPIRSMLMDLDESGIVPPATLIQWAQSPENLAYRDDFVALARGRPGFVYHPVVAENGGETRTWGGTRGSLLDAVGRSAPADARIVYVAGGEATIKRVREIFVARGLERKAVKWERFW